MSFKSDKDKCFYLLKTGYYRDYSPERMTDILKGQFNHISPFVVMAWTVQFIWQRAKRSRKWSRYYIKNWHGFTKCKFGLAKISPALYRNLKSSGKTTEIVNIDIKYDDAKYEVLFKKVFWIFYKMHKVKKVTYAKIQ